MSVSVDQIAAFLDQMEFKYERAGAGIRSAMQLAGDHTVGLIFGAPNEGKFFELSVGRIIPTEMIQASKHKAVFHLYLLSAAWETSFGTPEVDKDDGELRVLVEVPLADAVMTKEQLGLCIHGAAQVAEKIRSEGIEVLKSGQLPAQAPKADSETMARVLIISLMETAEGRAKARALAIDEDAPAAVREIAKKMTSVMDAMDQADAAPTSI